MGGIAIWCMHYIGNRAIVLGGGLDPLQIQYSSGFTALSVSCMILVAMVDILVCVYVSNVMIVLCSYCGASRRLHGRRLK